MLVLERELDSLDPVTAREIRDAIAPPGDGGHSSASPCLNT